MVTSVGVVLAFAAVQRTSHASSNKEATAPAVLEGGEDVHGGGLVGCEFALRAFPTSNPKWTRIALRISDY